MPGRDYLDACRQILEQVDEVKRAAGVDANVKGQLVVAVLIVFGRPHAGAGGSGLPEAQPRGRPPAAPGRPQCQPHRGACRRGASHRRLAGTATSSRRRWSGPPRGRVSPAYLSGSGCGRWNDPRGTPMRHLHGWRPPARGPSPTSRDGSGRRGCVSPVRLTADAAIEAVVGWVRPGCRPPGGCRTAGRQARPRAGRRRAAWRCRPASSTREGWLPMKTAPSSTSAVATARRAVGARHGERPGAVTAIRPNPATAVKAPGLHGVDRGPPVGLARRP